MSKYSGQCKCRTDIVGLQCNSVRRGSFLPKITINIAPCEETGECISPANEVTKTYIT